VRKDLAHAREPEAKSISVRCSDYGHKPGSLSCVRTQRNGGKKICSKCPSFDVQAE